VLRGGGAWGLARQAIDRAVSESQKSLYYIFTICQAINKSFEYWRLERKKFSADRAVCGGL